MSIVVFKSSIIIDRNNELEIRFNNISNLYQLMINGTIVLESYELYAIEKCIKDEFGGIY